MIVNIPDNQTTNAKPKLLFLSQLIIKSAVNMDISSTYPNLPDGSESNPSVLIAKVKIENV